MKIPMLLRLAWAIACVSFTPPDNGIMPTTPMGCGAAPIGSPLCIVTNPINMPPYLFSRRVSFLKNSGLLLSDLQAIYNSSVVQLSISTDNTAHFRERIEYGSGFPILFSKKSLLCRIQETPFSQQGTNLTIHQVPASNCFIFQFKFAAVLELC